MIIAYDSETGRYWRSDNLDLGNRLMKAKQTRNPWEVIDICVEAFKRTYPIKYKSYLVWLDSLRRSQKVTKVGSKRFSGVSKDKVNDAYLAQTVDFPVWIMMMIRKVYGTKELIMDKGFFRDFGKRYPEFRIMEKQT